MVAPVNIQNEKTEEGLIAQISQQFGQTIDNNFSLQNNFLRMLAIGATCVTSEITNTAKIVSVLVKAGDERFKQNRPNRKITPDGQPICCNCGLIGLISRFCTFGEVPSSGQSFSRASLSFQLKK